MAADNILSVIEKIFELALVILAAVKGRQRERVASFQPFDLLAALFLTKIVLGPRAEREGDRIEA